MNRPQYQPQKYICPRTPTTLGAGGREFKSLHPDTLSPSIVKDRGIFHLRTNLKNTDHTTDHIKWSLSQKKISCSLFVVGPTDYTIMMIRNFNFI